MKTLKQQLTNANFYFNSVKYGFLSLIAFTIINMVIYLAKNPGVMQNAFNF
jgi:hypothetical protein